MSYEVIIKDFKDKSNDITHNVTTRIQGISLLVQAMGVDAIETCLLDIVCGSAMDIHVSGYGIVNVQIRKLETDNARTKTKV